MEQNQQFQPPVFNPKEPTQQPDPQYQPRVNARPMLEPVQAVKICLKKFFDFTGRARRSEYWWFILFVMIVSMVFNFIGAVFPMVNILGLIVGLLLSIAQLAALTRRLHDTGRSGWWMAPVIVMFLVTLVVTDCFDAHVRDEIMLIYMFYSLVLMVFFLQDSRHGENQYGQSPKYP